MRIACTHRPGHSLGLGNPVPQRALLLHAIKFTLQGLSHGFCLARRFESFLQLYCKRIYGVVANEKSQMHILLKYTYIRK